MLSPDRQQPGKPEAKYHRLLEVKYHKLLHKFHQKFLILYKTLKVVFQVNHLDLPETLLVNSLVQQVKEQVLLVNQVKVVILLGHPLEQVEKFHHKYHHKYHQEYHLLYLIRLAVIVTLTVTVKAIVIHGTQTAIQKVLVITILLVQTLNKLYNRCNK